MFLLTENVYSFVNRDKLFQAVYNRPYDGYSRSVDVTISKIRKKPNDKDKVTILTSSQNDYSLNKEVKKFVSQSDL